MIVQIYEIQIPEEAEKCLEAGADRLGSVVLSEDRWRDPQLKEVTGMARSGGAKSTLIPLFRDKEKIRRLLDYYQPDYVHFCDNLVAPDRRVKPLDPYIRLQQDLKECFPEIGIIRSIPIPREGTEDDFPSLHLAKEFESVSDNFLTDTWLEREPVTGFIGITGQTVDWEIARELVKKSRIPVILAGGLSPDNVCEGLVRVLPAGADSCTWTNAKDRNGRPIRFKKDADEVRRFVREVRMAQETIGSRKKELEEKLKGLKETLKEREAALPAHSVRPHQLLLIEDLEEEIKQVEKEISFLERVRTD